MLDWNQITGFLAVAVALTLMPGPDILFVAAQSMTRSRMSGIAVALGLCTGLLVHTTAAALGVSAVVLSSPLALQGVKLLGALYLLYLAWKTWKGRHGGVPAVKDEPAAENGAANEIGIRAAQDDESKERSDRPKAQDDAGRLSFAGLYRRGITMNVINPKVSLFFLALLPQFVTAKAGSVPLQMVQLGLLFLAQALVVFTCVSLLASFAGGLLTSRSGRWGKRLAVAEAVIYVLLAVNLFFL